MIDSRPYEIQLRSKGIVLYPKVSSNGKGNIKSFGNEESNQTYQGKCTNKSQKAIMRIADYLTILSPKKRVLNPVINKYHDHQLTFITLTIPDKIVFDQHKQFKKDVLSPFMSKMVKYGLIDLYLYVCELTKQGNLHFHIMTNSFVHYQRIRDYWNQQLSTKGYMTKYEKMKGNSDANSTDVKSVVGSEAVAKYVAKYMSKGNVGEGIIGGRIWDCSRALKSCKYYSQFCSEVLKDQLWEFMINYEDRVWHKDGIYYIRLNEQEQKQIVPNSILVENWKYWEERRSELRQATTT